MTLQNRLATKMATALDVRFVVSETLTADIHKNLLDGDLEAACIRNLDEMDVEEIADNGIIFGSLYELMALPWGSGAFFFNPDRMNVAEARTLAEYLLR